MIIAFVFPGLAVLHIILHWKMILALYPRLIGRMVARRIIAVILVIAGLFFVVFPFVLKPEVQEPERKGRHYRESSDIKSKQATSTTPGNLPYLLRKNLRK